MDRKFRVLDQLDDFLGPARAAHRELDLAIDHQMKAGARRAALKDDLTALDMALARPARDGGQFFLRHRIEQRQARKKNLR